ncbi:hypothetical protein [Maridesulfovibrio bastinii]|nr:hypothetical protein [Maridesulfovibrio bastinii]
MKNKPAKDEYQYFFDEAEFVCRQPDPELELETVQVPAYFRSKKSRKPIS